MKPKEVSEKLRVVMEQHKDEYTETFGLRISDMARDSADAIDSLQIFVDLINSLPNCNDCGLKNCTSRPGLGETIRYNCSGYVAKDRITHTCKIGDLVIAKVVRPFNGHEIIVHGKVVCVNDKAFRIEYAVDRYLDFPMSDIGDTVIITTSTD